MLDLHWRISCTASYQKSTRSPSLRGSIGSSASFDAPGLTNRVWLRRRRGGLI